MLQDPKFFLTHTQAACSNCKTVPSIPLLCLLCNKLVCFKSECCKEGKYGEANLHAQESHSGQTVYLIIKESHLLVITKSGGALLDSPYLDKHGEQDKGLSRGKPVYLDLSRLENVKQLFLQHLLPSKSVHTFTEFTWNFRQRWVSY